MKKFIIHFITAFIPIKKYRKQIRKYLNSYQFEWCFISKYFFKCKLYYFHVIPNFGDVLALDLMKFFNVSFCSQPYHNANFVSIGSHLDSFIVYTDVDYKRKPPLYIWGTGFQIPPDSNKNESFNRPVKIMALRGKLSLQRCENILNRHLRKIALGDPGLLIRRLPFKIAENKKFDVGIVCHMNDKDSNYKKNIKLDRYSCLYIDIQQSTDEFIYQISQCRFILSSALHGLICADSLSIPNRHILLSDKVCSNNYKFKDYYSVFSCPYVEPIDLRDRCIFDDDINEIKKEYKISPKEIEKICDNLIKSFPPCFKGKNNE